MDIAESRTRTMALEISSSLTPSPVPPSSPAADEISPSSDFAARFADGTAVMASVSPLCWWASKCEYIISEMVAGGSSSPLGNSVGDDAVLPFGAMVEFIIMACLACLILWAICQRIFGAGYALEVELAEKVYNIGVNQFNLFR